MENNSVIILIATQFQSPSKSHQDTIQIHSVKSQISKLFEIEIQFTFLIKTNSNDSYVISEATRRTGRICLRVGVNKMRRCECMDYFELVFFIRSRSFLDNQFFHNFHKNSIISFPRDVFFISSNEMISLIFLNSFFSIYSSLLLTTTSHSN